jgi:hypothetical protein
MASIAVTPEMEFSGPKLVAPRWHTALLVALFLGLTLAGAFFQRAADSQPARLLARPNLVRLYLSLISLIAMEWGLVLYVGRTGLRRSGTKLRELIGGRWQSPKDLVVDADLALGIRSKSGPTQEGNDECHARSDSGFTAGLSVGRSQFGHAGSLVKEYMKKDPELAQRIRLDFNGRTTWRKPRRRRCLRIWSCNRFVAPDACWAGRSGCLDSQYSSPLCRSVVSSRLPVGTSRNFTSCCAIIRRSSGPAALGLACWIAYFSIRRSLRSTAP